MTYFLLLSNQKDGPKLVKSDQSVHTAVTEVSTDRHHFSLLVAVTALFFFFLQLSSISYFSLYLCLYQQQTPLPVSSFDEVFNVTGQL